MKHIPYLFLLLSSLFAAHAFAAKAASTGEQYLQDFLANTRSFQAVFQQTLKSDKGEVLQQTSGRFYLERPGKFRWDYSQPYEQHIVSDGERIWIYDVDLQQVTVQKQSAGLPTTPMALLKDKATLYESFDVIPMDHHEGIYRLKLQSKTKESDFGEVIVGIDKKGLRFLQLHDQFEQVTDIVFSDIETNVKLDEKLYHFDPPEGVDVFGG